MPVFTIFFGIALGAVGVGTYAGSVEPSLSALLLQVILGLLAIGLGVGSLVKKEMRMHLMHAAVLLAGLGVIIPLVRFGFVLWDLKRDEQMQLLRVLLTMTFSAAYVYAAVQSFRAARTKRTGDQPAQLDTAAEPKPDLDAPANE